MYESNVNDVLISCGGGELMCEILNFVDFDRIKAAKPKWYLDILIIPTSHFYRIRLLIRQVYMDRVQVHLQ